jgi:hypothetical protein
MSVAVMRCQRCRWFEQESHPGPDRGECRAGAPDGGSDRGFATVRKTDWCADFDDLQFPKSADFDAGTTFWFTPTEATEDR